MPSETQTMPVQGAHETLATSVFDCNSYREVLRSRIEANGELRGYKSRLAEAAGCHGSYLSQVLKGGVDLTFEQAVNLADFWKLDENETDYYLALLLRDRAGNRRLREHCETRLLRAREAGAATLGKNRRDRILPAEAAAIYYSSWHFAAVHALALTSSHSSVERLSERLRLPAAEIAQTLQTLERMGAIVPENGAWRDGQEGLLLPRSSPLSALVEAHWRQRALFSLQSRDPDALHLHRICGINKSDFARLRNVLVRCMNELRTPGGAPPDDAVTVNIDLFRV